MLVSGRKLILIFLITLGVVLAVLAYHQVDNSLTDEDIATIEKILENIPHAGATAGYRAEIELIKKVQKY